MGMLPLSSAITMKNLRVASRVDELSSVRRFVGSCLEDLPMSERERSNVIFSVLEAVINAMRHGNGMDPRRAVELVFDCDGEKVTIAIRDEGAGFDPRSVPDPTDPKLLKEPTGRGIFFMRQMMNEITFETGPSGTTVKMIKRYNGHNGKH